MPPVDMTLETDLSPEQVRGALIDFSPSRPELWPGIAPELYEVYDVGETSAHVKEGTKLPLLGSFWAKEHYDWADPQTVRWTVERSNFSTTGSFMSARLVPRSGGGTRIELHWEREGTTAVSRLICRLIVAMKGKPVAQSFTKGLERIRAAQGVAPPAPGHVANGKESQ